MLAAACRTTSTEARTWKGTKWPVATYGTASLRHAGSGGVAVGQGPTAAAHVLQPVDSPLSESDVAVEQQRARRDGRAG